MATPTAGTFDPQISSDIIWRGEDPDRSVTVDLDNMDAAIEALQTATNALEDEVDGKAPTAHSHNQTDITGLIAALAAKAEATHNHELSQITGILAALAAKADLVNGVVPESQLPGFVDDVIDGTLVSTTVFNDTNGTAVTPASGKIYNDTTANKSYRWSGSMYVLLGGGIALGETAATAHRGDHGKVAYEHSQEGGVHVTEAQKTSWNSKAAGNHGHSPTEIGAAPTDHSHTLSALGAAAASHSHPLAEITGLIGLLITGTGGGVKYNCTSGNMLSIINGWGAGVHTAYFMGGSTGCTNTPKTNESWRVLCHKTSATIGWVIAFGSSGSVYTNYIDSGTWRGWKAIYDANPAPLWGTSGYYMTAGHTVTPTKKLSECAHGWILAWSDFDKDTTTTNEKDWHFDVIPNRTPSGGTWNSKLMYFDIPRYIGDNTADTTTEKRIIKQVYVSDDKIVGHNANNQGDRHDVVLRAVYEF